MKKGTWNTEPWSPRTKWLTTVALLAAGGWLFVACAAEPGSQQRTDKELTRYQLRQVVVSAQLEQTMRDENTVTLKIEKAVLRDKVLTNTEDAAVKSTEWEIDPDSIMSTNFPWMGRWTPKTVWKTKNLVYGDCLKGTMSSSQEEVVMTLRSALGTGGGTLTLDDDDLSLRYEEGDSHSLRRLNVDDNDANAEAERLLQQSCEGEKVRFEQFSRYVTRDRVETVLHRAKPEEHGPIVVTEPQACPEQDATEECGRLSAALYTAGCKQIAKTTLWRCPDLGDGQWDQMIRNKHKEFVAAGRSIEAFGPDVVGIDEVAIATWTELPGVSPEQRKWVSGIYRSPQSTENSIEVSADQTGKKVGAYVPNGKLFDDKITWSFKCSPTESHTGKKKFDFGKVQWHKLQIQVKADDARKDVAAGWRLSTPVLGGTQITLGQDGTTEGAMILARFVPVPNLDEDRLQLTVSPPPDGSELIYEPIQIPVDLSELCPMLARSEPNKFVHEIELSPQTQRLSIQDFAGVAQKVTLPNSDRSLSDTPETIEVRALTGIELSLGERTAQPAAPRDFINALKHQQNQEERCAALRELFPELYEGRVVIYAPDTADIPVKMGQEVKFAKRIGGGFQTYSAQVSDVQVLTDGSWEMMDTELGCGFKEIGPRNAYVIVDTGEFSHSQDKRGKADECDDIGLSALQRSLFRCDSDEAGSAVSDPAKFEAVWIRCLERLDRNLEAAGAEKITIVQAHPNRQGGIDFSTVGSVSRGLDDKYSVLQKLSDAGYKLRRRAETAVRSDKHRQAMPGRDLALAYLNTPAPGGDPAEQLPLYVVFSQPKGERQFQTVVEKGAQLWIVPGLLTEPSCPIARFDAQGENQ